MWYDDNPKLPIASKIEDAIACYADRLGVRPTLVLVNEAELTEFPGIEVRAAITVRRNTYWVGQGDRPDAPVVVAPIAAAPIAAKRARAPRKARQSAN
jgi:hypothetical protein